MTVHAQTAGVYVHRGRLPTRKWIANAVTGVAGWGVLVLQSDAGGVTQTEWVALIVLAAQLAVTWLVPNAETPGGAPDARVVIDPK